MNKKVSMYVLGLILSVSLVFGAVQPVQQAPEPINGCGGGELIPSAPPPEILPIPSPEIFSNVGTSPQSFKHKWVFLYNDGDCNHYRYNTYYVDGSGTYGIKRYFRFKRECAPVVLSGFRAVMSGVEERWQK